MNQLRNIRKMKNMSRQELANMLGISVSALGRRERGESAMMEDEIRRASHILECSCSEIIGEDTDEK